MKRVVPLVVVVIASVGAWWFLGRQQKPVETPGRALFKAQLGAYVVARARGSDGAPELEACLTSSAPWPNVAAGIRALPDAWDDHEKLAAASAQLNDSIADAGLPYWVDPHWVREKPLLTSWDVLSRVRWAREGATTEALHVRRLDTLNLELGFLGHASGNQPAILRDRIELYVVDLLRRVGDAPEEVNPVDTVTSEEWRAQLGKLVSPEGVAEAESRLSRREQLARTMESRLKSGKIHVSRPERLVFGDAYFDSLEPYTSNTRRGGPILLGSDLRALRRADEALADSAGFQALLRIIELEAEVVEAHEVTHALDHRELPIPELLLKLAGADDLRFARQAERELRAYLGQLRFSGPPACLTIISLARTARGSRSQSTPHFFAAHTLLTVLGDVPSERGLDEEQVVGLVKSLCAMPDAELRTLADRAMETLYALALVPISPVR